MTGAAQVSTRQVFFTSLPWQARLYYGLPGADIAGASLPGPVKMPQSLRTPRWFAIDSENVGPGSRQDWHAPSLTPASVRIAYLKRERGVRRAQRMADRAFYFGVDVDNNALK